MNSVAGQVPADRMRLPSSSPYIGFQQEVWPRLEVCLSPQRAAVEVALPTSNEAQIPHSVPLHFGMMLNSRCSQVDSQE